GAADLTEDPSSRMLAAYLPLAPSAQPVSERRNGSEPPSSVPVSSERAPQKPIGLARGILRTMRPHQWVKNVFVLAPVVFAKELFDYDLLLRAGGAFIVFCLLAGAVYTVNDIVGAPADRVHPVKRYRPIASGVVPIKTAKIVAAILLALGMVGALYGPPLFALVVFLYFIQNLAYSFKLKS